MIRDHLDRTMSGANSKEDVLNGYLRWASDAEATALHVLDGETLHRLILTRRYWQIADASTPSDLMSKTVTNEVAARKAELDDALMTVEYGLRDWEVGGYVPSAHRCRHQRLDERHASVG